MGRCPPSGAGTDELQKEVTESGKESALQTPARARVYPPRRGSYHQGQALLALCKVGTSGSADHWVTQGRTSSATRTHQPDDRARSPNVAIQDLTPGCSSSEVSEQDRSRCRSPQLWRT